MAFPYVITFEHIITVHCHYFLNLLGREHPSLNLRDVLLWISAEDFVPCHEKEASPQTPIKTFSFGPQFSVYSTSIFATCVLVFVGWILLQPKSKIFHSVSHWPGSTIVYQFPVLNRGQSNGYGTVRNVCRIQHRVHHHSTSGISRK